MLWKAASCVVRSRCSVTHVRCLSFFRREPQDDFKNVLDGLKTLYREKLLPLEETYKFHEFHSPMLYDSDFEAKPLVLFLGQYSTGKTTLIKYLLDSEFPGIRIGPEPTTDRFIAIMYGEEESVIPGNAVVVDAKKQFRPLTKFGNNFLNRFQCSTLNNEVLKAVSMIDTPGILSGEKQRINRGYDFSGVLEWFGERVDRIMLLFDAHKLDISDEFRRCIEVLRKHDEKIRIVLNKSDKVDPQQLMRVYGALMWSLGKILNTPEVTRVYVGSFWDEALTHDENRLLFEAEEQDLLQDLISLPRNSTLRKLSDLSKRARLAQAHAYIMSHMQAQMPFFGRERVKNSLIEGLDRVYLDVQNKFLVSPGDLPDISKMREQLIDFDFGKLKALDMRLIKNVDVMLAEIAKLLKQLPVEQEEVKEAAIEGGAFRSITDTASPFGIGTSEGINEGKGEPGWIVERYRGPFDMIFDSLESHDGKLPRSVAKSELMKSKLPGGVLGRIWQLADADRDGLLNRDEFALAMHLVNIKLQGYDLPNELPPHLLPPVNQKPRKQSIHSGSASDSSS